MRSVFFVVSGLMITTLLPPMRTTGMASMFETKPGRSVVVSGNMNFNGNVALVSSCPIFTNIVAFVFGGIFVNTVNPRLPSYRPPRQNTDFVPSIRTSSRFHNNLGCSSHSPGYLLVLVNSLYKFFYPVAVYLVRMYYSSKYRAASMNRLMSRV